MSKFHINKHGVPAPCKATKGNCPLGGDSGNENHYNTEEEAQAGADKLHKSKFSVLPGAPTRDPKFVEDISGHAKELIGRTASVKLLKGAQDKYKKDLDSDGNFTGIIKKVRFGDVSIENNRGRNVFRSHYIEGVEVHQVEGEEEFTVKSAEQVREEEIMKYEEQDREREIDRVKTEERKAREFRLNKPSKDFNMAPNISNSTYFKTPFEAIDKIDLKGRRVEIEVDERALSDGNLYAKYKNDSGRVAGVCGHSTTSSMTIRVRDGGKTHSFNVGYGNIDGLYVSKEKESKEKKSLFK